MRALLDALYRLCGWLAALCLVVIAGMVGVQICGRIADGAMKLTGYPPYGLLVPGLAEIAGYLLAVSSLLALAATLKAGAHIRVTVMLSMLGERARRVFELLALTAAAAFSAYMTWRFGLLAYDSWMFDEVSYGLVPLRLAWPQAAMAIGLAVLTIALVDELVLTVQRGRPSYRSVEDAIALGREG
ncbi:MAG: TRAP transporter small permease [Hyphomicrobiaceae bacterium]|nr:TRAP transporter small permease [Hyphomicrobiaceae bacterium]